MATVTKDFRIKSGLIVEGTTGTIDGSDIITADKITGGTNIGVDVTYENGVVNFEVEASEAVSEIAQDAVANAFANATQDDHITISYDDAANAIAIASDATDDNTPSTIVSRNADGNFVANTITATTFEVDGIRISGYTVEGFGGLRLTDDTTTVYELGTFTGNLTGNVTGTVSDLSNHIGTPFAGHYAVVESNGVLAIPELNTDSVNESVGATNLYYTDERARAAVSGSSPVTYNPSTGEIGLSYSTTSLELNSVDESLQVRDVYVENLVMGISDTAATPNTLALRDATGSITTEGLYAASNSFTADSTGVTASVPVDLTGGLTVDKSGTVTDIDADGISTTGTVNVANVVTLNAAGIDVDGGITSSATVIAESLSIASNSLTADSAAGIVTSLPLVVTGYGIDASAITANALSMSNNIISNVAEPVDASDAATKGYVDAAVSGLNWKEAVNLLADSNVNLSASPSEWPIDGHAKPTTEYRVLFTGQTNAEENGIYVFDPVTEVYTRADDADTYEELIGSAVFVMEGTQYGATSWVQSNHYLVDFGNQAWSQFSGQGTYTAGTNLVLSGNEFSLADNVSGANSIAADYIIGDQAIYTANVYSGSNLGVNAVSTLNLNSIGDAVSITAAKGISLSSQDGTILESDTYLGSVASDNLLVTQGDLDGYLNSTEGSEGTTILYVQEYVGTAIETGDATATPTYLAIDYASVATQVAASTITSGGGTPVAVYSFDPASFRSAKFLVKMQSGTHTQVSEILLTLDSSDNIAITEYAIVGTNGTLGDISALNNAGVIELTVQDTTGLNVTVAGTLLV